MVHVGRLKHGVDWVGVDATTGVECVAGQGQQSNHQ